MCGIFGYIGKRDDAAEIIFGGLKTLEYRGYDSWGIAIKDPRSKAEKHKLLVDKEIGKLPDKLLQSSILNHKSTIGIGHTRWATHGGVTIENAHPHTDCTKQLAIIHNGIIENFQELKAELIIKGHKFISETDTEVAVHLIEENLKTTGFATSVKNAFNRLSGMNAIVVLNAASSEIIAAKNGSPLVIGIGEDEFFLASDASGILKYTKKVHFLEDHHMVILGSPPSLRDQKVGKQSPIKLLTLPTGDEVKPKYETLSWSFEDTQMGKYKHFFIKEIHEEARIIENTALNGLMPTKKLAKLIHDAFGTFLIACGSASYAAISATYLFSKIAKKHVNFAIGSEFIYLEDFITDKTLVIPISQSGESIDVIEPVTRAQNEKHAKIASIVNVLGSTLYRLADFNVLLESGTEKAVVATKSFIAMVATLILTAYTLADEQQKGQELLLKAAKNVKSILSEEYISEIKKIAEKLKKSEHIYIIGRGLAYTAALEAALKIKEASCTHAEAFPGGELKHGVIALIEKGTPTIVFAPADETYYDIISNAQEIKARGGYIIGIGPKNNEVFDDFLETDSIEEATILPQVTISHLLGYYLALARGIKDPDKPRNLAKSVTVK